MGCSLKGKCHSFSTFFQALLAIFKMFFALIMNAVALVSIIVAIVLVNICYVADKSMNDPTYSDRFLSADIKKLMTSCIFPEADGKVSGFVDDTTRFDTLIDMTKSFADDFARYNPRDGKTPDSESLELYDTNYFGKLETYETSDFTSQSSEDPMTLINGLNGRTGATAINCALDRITPHPDRCPTGYTGDISNAGTAFDYKVAGGVGDELCVNLANWNFVFGDNSATDRYSTNGNNCAASQAAEVERFKNCVVDINAKFLSFRTDLYNPGDVSKPNGAARVFYGAMAGIKTNYESISTAMNEAAALFKDSTASLDTFLNCKIIRSEMRNTFGNTCFRFGKNFARQAILLAIIGPLFWLLSCCVCCSFKQSKAVRKMKDLQKQEYEDNAGKQTGFDNMNNMSPAPYADNGYGNNNNYQ